jgi:hypothetical protein
MNPCDHDCWYFAYHEENMQLGNLMEYSVSTDKNVNGKRHTSYIIKDVKIKNPYNPPL